MLRDGCAVPPLLLAAIVSCSTADPAVEQETDEAQQYAAPAEDIRGEYEAFVRRWFDAYNARDIGALVTLYAPEAIRMPPGTPALRGAEAIRAGFAEEFERYAEFRSAGASQQVHFADGWALERGTYTFTTPRAEDGVEETERGKYVVVARRGPTGAWRILWEIWNANAAEPTPTGEASEGGASEEGAPEGGPPGQEEAGEE